MSQTRQRFGWLTIVWSVAIGIGIVVLAGSILLPSTKRARIDLDELRRRQQQSESVANESAADTSPAPTTQP